MIARLKAKHAAVVAELEQHGVEFNDIDRRAFEERTVGLYGTLPGVTMDIYDQIQVELDKIRTGQGLE